MFNSYLTFRMNTYCYYPCIDLYKYTKPHCQGRIYKYALLKNKSFRCKEYSKQILQKQYLLLAFLSHQFHIMKASIFILRVSELLEGGKV